MKTSELIGPALDWAVAKCRDFNPLLEMKKGLPYSPSTRWAQGGPIIEREKIDIFNQRNGFQGAIKMSAHTDPHPKPYFGETMLIAAMRCFVASKLGDEIDIPEELR